MSIYQFDEAKLPDCEFEPGEHAHLVVGNHGRLLDPRRTPVRVVDLQTSLGMFVIQLQAFEDEGALWEIPFEDIQHYQFMKGEKRATSRILSEVQRAVEQFDRPLQIACDQQDRAKTLRHLQELLADIYAWLDDHSRFFSEGRDLPDHESRKGDRILWGDLQSLMTKQDLLEVEDAFARQFVSNPNSGELVKGHRIVLAELGLVPYEGGVIRDPKLFDGEWSRGRRADHILYRQAFVQSVFGRLGHERVYLYRGISCQGQLRLPQNRTFVSATFSHAVAKSHFESGNKESTGALYRQSVQIERLFMTYCETEQLNRPFQEAEAILLYDDENTVF